MLSSIFRKLGPTKPSVPPIELSGAVGGVLMFYRSEIGDLVRWSRSMGQKGLAARPRDTQAECWAAIGLATTHLAGIPEDHAAGALQPDRVVDLLSPQVVVALAVFKTLSDPFMARRLVDEGQYAGELMSSVRGFLEGGAMLASAEQRAEIARRGADMFSCLTENGGGVVCLDLIASGTENWAVAMAEQNTELAEESRRAIALIARQIPVIAENATQDFSS